MSIKRFEEIEAWQTARVLCRDIFVVTNGGELESTERRSPATVRPVGSRTQNTENREP